MNEADISDILPTIEEQGNQFVDIVRNKAKEVVESTAFQKIFYKKSTPILIQDPWNSFCRKGLPSVLILP